MYEYLQDKLFLTQLDSLRVREEFVKITVLSWQEDAIQEIQGKVISGSLNIDGSSSLRRTANLTVFAEELVNDLTQIDDLLSINRKIKLEIGIVNKVPNFMYDTVEEKTNKVDHHIIDYKKTYGDIIWFPLGIFVIFDPNISHTTTGVNISLTLKDKMCLLNGDAGGVIPSAVEFHTREQEVDVTGETEIDNPTIRQIIIEVVNHWGKENLSKILVADVDERIKQVMQWLGNSPLYRYLDTTTGKYEYSIDYPETDPNNIEVYEAGADVGFIITDFIYPGELIGDIGQTVTGVLDQIIQLLGNYEYFYDALGNFRFQEIRNYLNTTYVSDETYAEKQKQRYYPDKDTKEIKDLNYNIDLSGGMSVYTFNNSVLVNSYSNAPLYSNIKNDFVVWGLRKDTRGNQFPVRYHLAIDRKPQPYAIKFDANNNPTEYAYGEHKGITLYTDEFDVIRARSYIMEFNSVRDFPNVGYDDRLYHSLEDGKYYEWKEMKYQETTPEFDTIVYTKDWREELYYQGLEAYNTATDFSYYFTELIEELPKVYDLQKQEFKDAVYNDPSSIDWFLDIIDSAADVGKYSVDNIGRRSQAVSEDGINCVFEQSVPDIVFIETGNDSDEMNYLRQECDKMGQVWTQIDPSIYELLEMGGAQNSAYQRVCEMLYQYTNMNNSITLNSLPIYYLEPNTRITVEDPAAGIYGDYVIKSISIPFDINSTMTLTASKALQKI